MHYRRGGEKARTAHCKKRRGHPCRLSGWVAFPCHDDVKRPGPARVLRKRHLLRVSFCQFALRTVCLCDTGRGCGQNFELLCITSDVWRDFGHGIALMMFYHFSHFLRHLFRRRPNLHNRCGRILALAVRPLRRHGTHPHRLHRDRQRHVRLRTPQVHGRH